MALIKNGIPLIGCASGLGGADIHTGEGPLKIKDSSEMASLLAKYDFFYWDKMIEQSENSDNLNQQISDINSILSAIVENKVLNDEKFIVIAGDHTSALGTWSGVHNAIYHQGELGLIWVDAHMDSHTPMTSETGHIHGMPLACLLGRGDDRLIRIANEKSKLRPENVCLIGVRSFEAGEAELLRSLNVKIYYMDEIIERGLKAVFKEASELVSKNTIGFGISFDIDCIDPKEAPGVDVPEANGMEANETLQEISRLFFHEKLFGLEIVEYDPLKDVDDKTKKIVFSLLARIAERNLAISNN